MKTKAALSLGLLILPTVYGLVTPGFTQNTATTLEGAQRDLWALVKTKPASKYLADAVLPFIKRIGRVPKRINEVIGPLEPYGLLIVPTGNFKDIFDFVVFAKTDNGLYRYVDIYVIKMGNSFDDANFSIYYQLVRLSNNLWITETRIQAEIERLGHVRMDPPNIFMDDPKAVYDFLDKNNLDFFPNPNLDDEGQEIGIGRLDRAVEKKYSVNLKTMQPNVKERHDPPELLFPNATIMTFKVNGDGLSLTVVNEDNSRLNCTISSNEIKCD